MYLQYKRSKRIIGDPVILGQSQKNSLRVKEWRYYGIPTKRKET